MPALRRPPAFAPAPEHAARDRARARLLGKPPRRRSAHLLPPRRGAGSHVAHGRAAQRALEPLATNPLDSPARTRAHGRPTANEATCSPPAWLTGRLHDGGIRSVRSPLRRVPLLATPIATPLQGGRPERPGLLFLKLPFTHTAHETKKIRRLNENFYGGSCGFRSVSLI